MLLSASCTATFLKLHTLSFPKKETLFTTSALRSYQPSFLLPFRKNSKDTCIHVSRITSVHSLLVLFSSASHVMISLTPSGFEELLALCFISVSEVTSDGKCPVASLKQIAIWGKSGQIFGGQVKPFHSIIFAEVFQFTLYLRYTH